MDGRGGDGSATGPPSGTIAFLFTDIEGSTRLWATEEAAMRIALERHDEIIRRSLAGRGGWVFSTAGDGLGAAFPRASEALHAALRAQEELGKAEWPTSVPIKVRMGLHVGEATERDGNYFGPAVNLAARVCAAGHGGQTLTTPFVAVPPSLETHDLGEFRLRGIDQPVRIHQVGPGRFPSLRAVHPDRIALPSTTPIIGREEDVDRIRRLLVEHRLVTLTGVGGSGKTRLALEVASEELPGREGGTYFVDLSPFGSGDEVPAAVAKALKLQLAVGDPVEQVVDYLSDKNALVVLDNCEHLIEAAGDLAERFCERESPARLLATSRELLGVPRERVVAVQPLSSDGWDAPAVRLFLERAKEVGGPVEEADVDSIVDLCGQLDGLPLAIELAASRLAVLSPQELVSRIDERFRLLSGGRRRNRSRTLEAAIDWSYDLLDPDERRAFRSLGVFPGAFDIRAAAAICGLDEMDTVDRLESLADKSMLVVERSGPTTRYRLLETLRAYALSKLREEDELRGARDAHLDHFRLDGDPTTWPKVLDLELAREWAADVDDLLAAMEWAVGSDRWDDAIAVGWRMSFLAPATGFEATAVHWMTVVLEHLEPDHPLVPLLRLGRAILSMPLDDFAFAAKELDILLNEEHHDEPMIDVAAAGFQSFFMWALNHVESAKDLLARADAIERSRGPSGMGDMVEWVRGSLAIGEGDLRTAQEAFARGIACDAGVRVSGHEMLCAVNLAMIQTLTGEAEQSLETLDRYDWSLLPLASDGVVRTVAFASLGDLDNARREARAFAETASLGRYRRHANDAVLAFAVLAMHDDPRAVPDLLMAAGIPRHPHTLALSLHLAERIGCRDEISAMMDELREARQRPDARDTLVELLEELD